MKRLKALKQVSDQVVGFVSIKDVLKDCYPIEVHGLTLDLEVNVTVIMRGSGELEVEFFDVVGDIVHIHMDEFPENKWLRLGWSGNDNILTGIKSEIKALISDIAVNLAKNTKEESWQYYVLD